MARTRFHEAALRPPRTRQRDTANDQARNRRAFNRFFTMLARARAVM